LNLQALQNLAGEPTIDQRKWYSLAEDISEIYENNFTMIRHAATLYSFSYHNMQHKAIIQHTFIMYLCNSL